MPSVFTPTPAETTLVHQIFQHADPQKLGIVTGEAAVKVFEGAKLQPALLAEIWAMADDENNGWLSKKGVAKAVRLIGWTQQGRKLTEELLDKPGPLAKIEGINSLQAQNTGMSLPKSPLPVFPVLTPQDRDKFQNIFRRAGPVNGLLSGDKARDIFLKSKLPTDQLIQIWNLADTQDRGALDSTDFAIGMFFINGLMSKTISFIPTSLPPGLYQQAGGAVASHLSGNSGTFSPAHSTFSIQPQSTGQRSTMIQPNHTGMSVSSIPSRPAPALPARPSVVSSPFNTPAQPAANFDSWFDGLDTQKAGYIEGEVAVPFMLQSGLPGEILASVWDLADINNDGRLTRDGFAVAMYLIQKKLIGVEIPTQLPPSLIPPSMRARVAQQSAPPPQQDLFSFDDSPPPSAIAPQQTGGFGTLQAQQTGSLSTLSAQQTGARPPQHDPFRPTAQAPERAALEENFANQAAQLQSLQMQLSSAKASYESEIQLLSNLKDRHTNQQQEIQKTREELIRAESDLSALKVEKAEIEGAFMRDKEDARELHRRMIETGQQAEAVKLEVEKLKKDAKQQKGLLAIAKKQLSSKEAEKAKADKELEEASAEVASITHEQSEVDASIATLDAALAAPVARPTPASLELAPTERVGSVDSSLSFAAAQPLPLTPDLTAASPSVSIKSNNPFDRLKAGSSTPRSQSPFASFSPTTAQSDTPADIFSEDLFMTGPQEDAKAESIEGLAYDLPESSKPAALEVSSGHLEAPGDLLSPTLSMNETEFFHTPPTSAHLDLSPSVEATKFPAIDEFTSVFAPVPESIAGKETEEAKEEAKPATDDTAFDAAFSHDNHDGKELEIEESDSDSDSDLDDEDEVPLSELKRNSIAQAKAQAPVTQTSFDDVFGESNGTEAPKTEEKKAEAQPEPNFDDIFGGPVPSSQTNGIVASPKPAAVEVKASSPEPVSVAGVDVFDEALGKLSPTNSAAPAQQFSFDSAFDDNFDFAAAKADFTPAPVQQTPQQTNFGAIFAASGLNGNGNAASETAAPPAEPKPVETAPAQAPVAISFDDTFSGDLASSLNGPAKAPSASPQALSPPIGPSSSTSPFPSLSPSGSPRNLSGVVMPRPASSYVRPTSPLNDRPPLPARAASPKPRLSSSSSKDGNNEKPAKEPAPRHSKISLRLPFGRKKKDKKEQHEPMPPPPTHLSPHAEGVERTPTPAVDDDVEAVKQLTSMGFSRSQAVAALEKHSYDVQRALNSLLATAS
ncbi:UBA/TS-N domain-containing protein [Ephemerocybe angulata]|uniref:UBA/TS-N domain-containing protein n=1 Tax=Ephemerocybe angulata TaxID=980116 RepID=A0A8H6IG55_9AGAR|nr:UBA/TS-N domain-containing protein [Tulosesus angulatus]